VDFEVEQAHRSVYEIVIWVKQENPKEEDYDIAPEHVKNLALTLKNAEEKIREVLLLKNGSECEGVGDGTGGGVHRPSIDHLFFDNNHNVISSSGSSSSSSGSSVNPTLSSLPSNQIVNQEASLVSLESSLANESLTSLQPKQIMFNSSSIISSTGSGGGGGGGSGDYQNNNNLIDENGAPIPPANRPPSPPIPSAAVSLFDNINNNSDGISESNNINNNININNNSKDDHNADSINEEGSDDNHDVDGLVLMQGNNNLNSDSIVTLDESELEPAQMTKMTTMKDDSVSNSSSSSSSGGGGERYGGGENMSTTHSNQEGEIITKRRKGGGEEEEQLLEETLSSAVHELAVARKKYLSGGTYLHVRDREDGSYVNSEPAMRIGQWEKLVVKTAFKSNQMRVHVQVSYL
jgi:hypothetical protein